MNIVIKDGKLTKEEALRSLGNAAQVATESLSELLKKCDTEEEKEKVWENRDVLLITYLECMKKSLALTGESFENIASDLESAAKEVNKKITEIKNGIEAINLMADLVGLAGRLALAFV